MDDVTIHDDVLIRWEVPALLRWLGAKDRRSRGEYRMRWGSLDINKYAGFAFGIWLFEHGYSFHFTFAYLSVFVDLPFLRKRLPKDICESWGFSGDNDCLHLSWGNRTKIVWWPWNNWIQTRHLVLCADGSWAPFIGSWEGKGSDGRHLTHWPYRYVLRSGEVQTRTATIFVERRERKLAWFKWLPFKRVWTSIDVQFSDEVGEGTGSWKGGVVGCSQDLRPNETPRECLRRMENEKRFER